MAVDAPLVPVSRADVVILRELVLERLTNLLEGLLGPGRQATFLHSRAHVAVPVQQPLAAHLPLYEAASALADRLFEDDAVPVLRVDLETPLKLLNDVVEVIGLDLLARLIEEFQLHLVRFLQRLPEGFP